MVRKSETSPDPIDAWARLQRASGKVLACVESRLKADGFPPLAWYDILLELRRADGKALRPVDIEKRILLAQYNVSRLIDRLVTAGYVDKRRSPEDGRGVVICLLPEGEQLLKSMWPCYREAVEAEFAADLDKEDLEALWRILGKVLP
ncbi:MarR family winged helix-turn-helix transcriptional regulator [Roseibium sediminicola]|uniref:MarR family winged helix-turn-helix transcriptional regulator n=1 Tax=Roseibium sediminicola TaxID=2933272 RepID=A0ABT0GNC4_9HYPH|nr:MarR family winged helix-turn-helix transcriptional regulator [Roseibium sp. CAU 1639]MCK7610755.1 MarR family winged helix-turn-helix transcriptional regulator [Roseibium sp. CAU 1639]